MKRATTCLITAATVLFGLGTSSAGTITFNDIAHGEEAGTQILGLTISADNFSSGSVDSDGNHPDLALGFNTGLTGTRDDDLEGPSWAGGNLTDAQLRSLELATVIIIAENDIDELTNGTGMGPPDGLVDDPDDEGNRGPAAGSITFEFANPITSIGFDLLDVEGVGVDEEPGDFATFMMGLEIIASIPFSEFLPGGMHDRGAVFGNNTLNRIAPISGPAPFDTVVITMGGSGAVDNLVFGIPAPGAIGLLGLGLGLLGVSRQRRP